MKRKYKVHPRNKRYKVETTNIGDDYIVTLSIGDNKFSFEPKKKIIAKAMAINLDRALERMLHEHEIITFRNKSMEVKFLPV